MTVDMDKDRWSFTRLAAAHPGLRYGGAVIGCAITVAIASSLSPRFDLANIVMLFLLAVVVVTIAFGRGPGVAASFLSVALFDFFFVPPTHSFSIADSQYLLTFAVMLIVALTTAQLMSRLQRQASSSFEREQRIAALYDLSRELAGAIAPQQVEAALMRFIAAIGRTRGAMALIFAAGSVPVDDAVSLLQPGLEPDPSLVEAAMRTGHPATFRGVGYFPIASGKRVRGVLAVTFDRRIDSLDEHRSLLEALAALVAIVVERMHYIDVAARHELAMQAERLQGSILAALSHDIRTPLTALTGNADALAMSRPPLASHQADLAQTIRSQAARLNSLATNLLDMARLNVGAVRLRKAWQPIEEVIGSSLEQLEGSLDDSEISVSLPESLPLLEFDAVLIERVLCNLIENAMKYSAPAIALEISAVNHGDSVRIDVRDHGPGVAPADRQRIFAPFTRGTRAADTQGSGRQPRSGTGLGLAICAAIVEAHNGRLAVDDAEGGGARFSFTLPKGTPPVVEVEAIGTR